MRRKEKRITDQAAIDDILHTARVVHLAMVDDGRPYVVPMNFGYAEGCLWLHCARDGRKLDILSRNPAVCFEVTIDESVVPPVEGGKACDFSSKYRSVIGAGRVTIIDDDPAAVRRGLDMLMRDFVRETCEYNPRAVEKVAVLRVDIDEMAAKQG